MFTQSKEVGHHVATVRGGNSLVHMHVVAKISGGAGRLAVPSPAVPHFQLQLLVLMLQSLARLLQLLAQLHMLPRLPVDEKTQTLTAPFIGAIRCAHEFTGRDDFTNLLSVYQAVKSASIQSSPALLLGLNILVKPGLRCKSWNQKRSMASW
jgi:hypothetical protein